MRFKRNLTHELGLGPLIITPFLDIIFLIVIFFIFVTSLVTPSGISIKLPKAIPSEVLKEENFIIIISSENIIYLNGKIVNEKDLKRELKKYAQKNNPLLIRADRRAFLGRIIDIWNLCRELGIEKVNIATN